MNLEEMTIRDIETMKYADFVALIRETNRCPGGKHTIQRIREIINIDKETNVLEIGSNTGFTSLEFAHITRASVYGIDISQQCVAESNRLLSTDTIDVQNRTKFKVSDACSTSFENEKFDIIMTGGATGFISDKNKVIHEYMRLLKPWGYLVMTPLIYHTKPPVEIVQQVSEIIGAKISPMFVGDWVSLVHKICPEFELYFTEAHTLMSRTSEEISSYVDFFMKKEHMQGIRQEIKEAINRRLRSHLGVFNDNHKYLGYEIIIFRKCNYLEEPEFFISNS